MAARKKPTKAQTKAKKAKRQQTGSVTKTSATSGIQIVVSATPQNPNATKKVLHVGAGKGAEKRLHKVFKTGEWQEVRVNSNASTQPDIVGSYDDVSEVSDESMDAVYCVHGLNKLYSHELGPAIQGWKRTLKENGVLMISVPDAEKFANYIARNKALEILYNTPSGPVTPMDLCYGHRRMIAAGNEDISHKCAFTAMMLGEFLKDAGFSHIKVTRDGFDLWAVGYKMGFENPDRLEEMAIQGLEEEQEKLSEIITKENQADKGRHPGYVEGQLSDELNQQPKNWKPVSFN